MAGAPKLGGGERDRTDDLLLAKQALSQLSYTPNLGVVGLGRVELPTSRLSGVRSNHLSYRPQFAGQADAWLMGLEPTLGALARKRCEDGGVLI